jgi:hypothetical protein
MNANSATKPGMMPIKNLAKNGPVGVLKPRCITASERIGHWTKTRQPFARFSGPEASNPSPSLADSIAITSGFRFSVHTALPKATNDPVQQRRVKFITKLEEQKLLLKDPNHVRTVQRWTKVDGQRQATTKQQAVRPWWKTDPAGQVVMSVKFGAKPIEFEKGKAGIVVPSKDKLPAVIDTLIAAVRAGELDDLFSQAAKTGSIGKAKKAA